MGMQVKDVMTKNPITVRDSDTILEVAKKMRDNDIGDVLVCDDGGALRGIVTDRDLVVRAMAQGKDLSSMRVGEICSREPECLQPSADLSEAVDCMREKAIRRIPVVDDGKPVGIVSLGDLAQARDADSALGQISAAPPNN